MPKKGSKVSEETKARMRESWRLRDPHPTLTGKYGLSEDTIRAEMAAGNRWCGSCKNFLNGKAFGKSLKRCRECQSRFNKENYQRHRDDKLHRRKDYYWANLDSEKHKRKKEQFAKYGIDHQWYERTLAEQGGGCAICGATKPDKRSKFMFVDHRHDCHPIRRACNDCRRGLLCGACNKALERLETIPGWSEKALAYLARYR